MFNFLLLIIGIVFVFSGCTSEIPKQSEQNLSEEEISVSVIDDQNNNNNNSKVDLSANINLTDVLETEEIEKEVEEVENVVESNEQLTLPEGSQSGVSNAVHDNSYVYTLPYLAGSSFMVGQAYNGGITHFGELAYAIDWMMDEGTPILATRDGVVLEVVNNFDVGQAIPEYYDKINFITIQHLDGTVGYYGHNLKNTAKVRVGQNVKAGDMIVLSGCSGFCGSPHLHFHVQKTLSNNKIETIPVVFKIGNNEVGTIIGEKYYKAPVEKEETVDNVVKNSNIYSEFSLVSLPDKLLQIINSKEDRGESAVAFRDYLKNNESKIKSHWKEVNEKAMAGDQEAVKELQAGFEVMSPQEDYRFGKIFDPALEILPEAEEGMMVWWGLLSVN